MIGPSSARITRTMKMPSSIGKKKLHALKKYYGAKHLNGSLGPGTQDPNEGTQMLGPKYWDPNSEVWNVRVPSAGTHHPGTQMKGPR